MDAPKLNPQDTLRQSFPKLNQSIDNANEALKKSGTAVNISNNAINVSNEAKGIAERTQSELSQAILEGDSSPLAGQLSVGADGTIYNDGPQERFITEYNHVSTNVETTQLKMESEEINVLFLPILSSLPPAIADGITDTTQRLNDIFSMYRGRKIFIPDGIYLTSNSLILYDDSTYELGKNATIMFASYQTNEGINPNKWEGKHILKAEQGAKNIEIYGGTIWGQGTTQPQDMHRGLFFWNVEGLKVHDIKIKEVAGWGIAHIICKDFHFYNIEFDQCPESKFGYNGDGLTGMSSTNGIIENISGYSSDDLVALYAGSIFFPTDDIKDVIIRNIFPRKKKWFDVDEGIEKEEITHRPVALYASSEKRLDNIIVENVQGFSTSAITLVNRRLSEGYGFGYANNIIFRNLNLEFDEYMPTEYEEAFIIKDMICGTITIDNGNFDIPGHLGNIRRFLTIDNSKIDTLNIINPDILIHESDGAAIVDNGSVKNINLTNPKLMFGGDLRGRFYYKQSTLDTSILTTIRATDVETNGIVGIYKPNSDLKIRIDTWDLLVNESTVQLSNQNENDRIKTEKGIALVKNNSLVYIDKITSEKRIPVSGGLSYNVALTGKDVQANSNYGVICSPEWNSGGMWITNKTTSGFTVNWASAPSAQTNFSYKIVAN